MSKLSNKQSKKYTIYLADWVFYDPTFSNETHLFIPLSRQLMTVLNAGSVSDLGCILLIRCIELATILRRTCIELDTNLLRTRGRSFSSVLEELERNQILTDWHESCSYILKKERKNISTTNTLCNEESNISIVKKEDEKINSIFVKENQDEFIKKLSNFVTEEMGSVDTGFIKSYWKKIYDAFLSYDAFHEFVDGVYEANRFSKIEKKISKKSYFKKALQAELDRRGV